MRSESHLLREFFLPIIIIAIIVSFFLLTEDGISKRLPARETCLNWQSDDRGTSEILFIGSSRAFRAVELVKLREALEKDSGEAVGVELIYTLGSNMMAKAWATSEYLENGATPKTVVFEPTFSSRARDSVHMKEKTFVEVGHVGFMYMPVGFYRSVQGSLNNKYRIRFARVFDRDYMNVFEFSAKKYTTSVNVFFNSPLYRLFDRETICPKVFEQWNPKSSVYSDESTVSIIANEDFERRYEVASAFQEISPKSKSRTYEVAMTEYIIELLKAHGVEKIYLWFPSDLSQSHRPQYQNELEELFGHQVEAIYYSEIFEVLDDRQPGQVFFNENHLNGAGREVITDFWAQKLSGRSD